MIIKWVAIMNATFLVSYMIRELAGIFREGEAFLQSFKGN